jgi:hypothetical protein
MFDKFEIEGQWWLPDEPDRQIQGTLIFSSHEGPSLELQGSFEDVSFTKPARKRDPLIILGLSNNEPVTLYKAYGGPVSASPSGKYSKSKFLAMVVLRGAHFDTPESILFKQLAISLDHIGVWAVPAGIVPDIQVGQNAWLISYKRGDIELYSSNTQRFYISIDAPWRFTQRDAHIFQEAAIRLEFEEEQPWDRCERIILTLSRFFSLACLEPVLPSGIVAWTENALQEALETSNSSPVKVSYQITDIETKPSAISSHSMLFNLEHVVDWIKDMFSAWFDSPELQQAFSFFFAQRNIPYMCSEYSFFAMVQTLESYHRLRFNNSKIPSNVFKHMVERITSSCPEEYRDWLKEKIRYTNEVTFRRRIEDVTSSISDVIDITGKTWYQGFVNGVRDTRNALVHPEEAKKKRMPSPQELRDMTERLAGILEIALLKELKLPLIEIKKLVEEYPYAANRKLMDFGTWR